MKQILLLILLMGVFCSATAETLLRDGHPDRYVVQEGDTLWAISSMFLQDPWLWPEIWKVNPQVDNPHLIYPGDIILLRYIDGQPSIVVVRPGDDLPTDDDDGEQSLQLEDTRAIPSRPKPRPKPRISKGQKVTGSNGSTTDKLVPRIREHPLASPIPAIPLDAIAGLLAKGRVVDKQQVDDAPYIIAGYDDNLIFGPGNIFYARAEPEVWERDAQVYGVYKTEEIYRDPETNKILGVEAREAGLARLSRSEDEVATFDLISVSEDIRIGDRLLPTEERRLESTFFPKAPSEQIDGAIMDVIGGLSGIGTFDAIALNKGEDDGLAPGDILEIFRRGRRVDDPRRWSDVTLPSERSGLVMVYRVFDKMSYGIVLQSRVPMHVGDPARSP